MKSLACIRYYCQYSFSRYQGVHTDLSSSWVAVFCIQADDFQEVRVDVDSDTTVDHSPNFNLRTRHCEQSTRPWLGQVRQTAEECHFRSRQRW